MKIIPVILCVILLTFSAALATDHGSDNRPKIGLVLSGGAAKGMAHIGVLKVLEEMGIYPDYITGTSMGAVVGGLYAMGYSADEIAFMAEDADWNFLLSDRLPLNKVAYEEKYEYQKYVMGIPIRNYKFKLPSGVIVGQQLEKLLAELMWPLEKDICFDSLPIPFHCLGVDLISGEVVEFNSGNLLEGIRASMSIPSIFSPQSIDSMLLVDGGTLRNFPVAEVKKMGADIVIGVYVGFEEKVSKEDLFSMVNVLSRSTVLQGIVDAKQQSKLSDIYIEPELKGLSAGEFTRAPRFIELGQLAAWEHKAELLKLADSIRNDCRKPVKKIVPGDVKISTIEVVNDRRYVSDRFVIARSGIEEGDLVSRNDLSEAIDKIYGTQYFQKVNYFLEVMPDGNYKLIFKVREYTRAYLNFAAHYSNQYGPGVITNLTLRNYMIPETRALISLNIAEDPNLYIDINKYFGQKQRLMKRTFFEWDHYRNYFYRDGIDLGCYRLTSIKAGIGGKYSLSTNHQIGADGFFEKQSINPGENLKNYFQTQSFKEYAFRGFGYKLYYHVNSTDKKFFPESGLKFDLWYKYFFNPDITYRIDDSERQQVNDIVLFREDRRDFSMIYMNFEKYFTLVNRVTFNFGATAGLSSDASIGMGNFVVGGVHSDRKPHYIPFAGKRFAEQIAPGFGLIKAGFDIEIFPDIYISAMGNMAMISSSDVELIDDLISGSPDFHQKGICAGIQANTLLGPVSIMAGKNNIDHGMNWYINIGYPF